VTTATYLGASASAIQHHYDLGNEFYRLWLDPAMVYSCALWESERDDLATAQSRKLDYLIGQAHGAHVRRVLDVGCGWGALLSRLVKQHGVKSVTGLTLSQAQADDIATWSDNRYDVRVQNWISHTPEQPYDAIISIGAFEHFADLGLARAGRLTAYREFFARCQEWLPPGGRLALQTNVKGNNTKLDRQMVKDMLFIIDHIFPESELPWTSEIIEASERLFDTVSVRNDPDHYIRTLRCWHESLRDHREQAVELVGERIVADYERYLSSTVTAFERRHLGLVRITFERVA
jgi:cyclopropane-fatty-acyl-phospholipid synthase